MSPSQRAEWEASTEHEGNAYAERIRTLIEQRERRRRKKEELKAFREAQNRSWAARPQNIRRRI
jgi:hypothetical protein